MFQTNDIKRDFQPISINKASSFKGYCSRHDTSVFNIIENNNIDFNNSEHLFLVAYRSVLEEFRKREKAHYNFEFLWNHNIDLDLDASKDWYDNIKKYKKKWDKIFMNQNYNQIENIILTIKHPYPTIAVSQLFSIDHMDPNFRICLNVIPISESETKIFFSCLKYHMIFMKKYLGNIAKISKKSKKEKISMIIIQNTENFYIRPSYFAKWNKRKKELIRKIDLEGLFITYLNVEDKINIFA